MRTLAIAVVQTAPVPHDVEASWQRFAERVRSVKGLFPHVELVVVPELFLAAEGPLLTQAPVGWISATPGDSFTVFDIPGKGKVGLAICYDGSFPETVRQLAWLGAEVVIQPTLTTTRDREMELVCARANAWTNQVYVVNVNASDPAAVGQSAIVDPEGLVRQQAGAGEEVLVDVLDLDAVTRVRRFGSAGINRPWAQLARYGAEIQLPMYGGSFVVPEWAGQED